MKKIKPVHIILFGFLFVILIGSVLLTLPISSKSGEATPYINALFTSTTSVCVTGLVVETTMTYWSTFGQLVILVLIQLGGLGVITFTTGMFLFLKKKLTMKNRILIQESFSLNTMSGLIELVRKILKGTFIIEGIGAALFATQFIPEFGVKYGIWASVFNSVSAFCNAGIDIIQTDSLRSYITNPVVNFTVMALIVLGGLGFIVWRDLLRVFRGLIHREFPLKRAFGKLKLHSKIVLSTTVILIFIGTVFIFIFEFANTKTIGNLSLGNKLMASMFQSVTVRTAGFETVPQAALTEGSSLISMILMFIGGSPVGTAGGVKTVTFVVLVYCVLVTVKQEGAIHIFKRTIPMTVIPKALTIICVNLIVLLSSILVVLVSDSASFMDTCYECVSALGTVGLSKGLTPDLSVIGRLAIIITMYLGRVGPVSLAVGFAVRGKKKVLATYPEEDIILG